MARVVRGGGQALYVWKNVQLTKSRVFIFGMLLALAFLLFILNVFPYATVGVLLIPVSYLLGVYSYRSYLTWVGGSVGEREVAEELGRLDDSFTVISGVVVPPNRGDTDHIILGRDGIFVVETKNVGGEVFCVGDEWSRRKTGRMGGVYELKIGSPSRQVKRNAKVLKDFILEHQKDVFLGRAPHIWVNSIVVFTNRDVKLDLKNPTVEVVKTRMLVERITNTKGNVVYSSRDIEKMAETIMRHSS